MTSENVLPSEVYATPRTEPPWVGRQYTVAVCGNCGAFLGMEGYNWNCGDCGGWGPTFIKVTPTHNRQQRAEFQRNERRRVAAHIQHGDAS